MIRVTWVDNVVTRCESCGGNIVGYYEELVENLARKKTVELCLYCLDDLKHECDQTIGDQFVMHRHPRSVVARAKV